jgi:hypothetical protein
VDQRHNALINNQIRASQGTCQLPPLSSTAMQARRGVCAAHGSACHCMVPMCVSRQVTRRRGIENIMSPQSCRHGGRQGTRVECDSSTPIPPLHPRAPPLELTRTIPHKIIHSPAHHTESRTPCSKGSHHLSIKTRWHRQIYITHCTLNTAMQSASHRPGCAQEAHIERYGHCIPAATKHRAIGGTMQR